MSTGAPIYDKADPRLDKIYPFHLPYTAEWEEQKDWFSQSSMMSAGAGMFLKNPLIAWASMISAVIGLVNQQPLRAPKDQSSPLVTLGLSLAGIIALNMPKMILAPEVSSPVTPMT
ncbi:MAG: hypothetical protein TREMPRED_003738 [Tremellales sp. Tagirdzhanova-0007]|nr:MAG: hypothetical protein TREMPRED_003738 [Tremellales sp. Tagirdzhanova-0007]